MIVCSNPWARLVVAIVAPSAFAGQISSIDIAAKIPSQMIFS